MTRKKKEEIITVDVSKILKGVDSFLTLASKSIKLNKEIRQVGKITLPIGVASYNFSIKPLRKKKSR